MRHYIALFATLIASSNLHSQDIPAWVDITNLDLNPTDKTIEITYDLFDQEGQLADVSMRYSEDGKTYMDVNDNLSGTIGTDVIGGVGLVATWDYSNTNFQSNTVYIKLIADDKQEVDLQAIVDQVDADLMEINLREIERIRHHITNPSGLNFTRDKIRDHFQDHDFEIELQEFPYSNTTGLNIIGDHIGTKQDQDVIIIDAHYDSVSDSPGADDNGSGVIGFLEAARVLSQFNFNKTVRFIGFDLEELGLRGSQYYADNLDPNQSILGVLNLEMIGYASDEVNSQSFPNGFETLFPDVVAEMEANEWRGDFIGNISLESFNPLAQAFKNAAEKYIPERNTITLVVPDNVITLVPDLLRSDHAPFWGKNIPALLITDTSEFRNGNYHGPNDTVETLDFNYMHQTVKAVIGTVLEYAEVNHTTDDVETINLNPNGNDDFDDCSFNPIYERGWIHLNLDECLRDAQVKIIDITGKTIGNHNITEETKKIKPSADLNGMYFLNISNGLRQATKRILIHNY